jgi:hypothetical protein
MFLILKKFILYYSIPLFVFLVTVQAIISSLIFLANLPYPLHIITYTLLSLLQIFVFLIICLGIPTFLITSKINKK